MSVLTVATKRLSRVFYGWWIVFAGIGIQTLITGLLMNAYGSYVAIMQVEFGWSRTAFSIAYSLQHVESGLLGPAQGWLLDKFGPKPVMTAGLLLFGAGFIVFSQVNSLWSFYAAFLILAIGASLSTFASIGPTIVNWFSRLRSTAMGISHAGLALGGVMVPLVALSLSTYGWRSTAFASGIIVICVGVPLAQVFRHTPEQYGLRPDGDPVDPVAEIEEDAEPRAVTYDDSNDFTPRQAMRTAAFWLLSLGHAMGVIVVGVVQVHAVVHMTESLGFSLTAAASVIALLTACTIVGNLVGGVLGDRLNKRFLAASCLLASGAALIMLGYAESTVAVIAFAVIQGLAHGFRGVLMVPLRADYFGRKSIATIMGFSSMIIMWGMILGPIIAGVMADALGNYRLAFTILGAVVAAGSLTFFFARKPIHPSQRAAAAS